MAKTVITISGNIGVGKTTLGEQVAKFYNAAWLPESSISSLFQHLVACNVNSSRLIAQMAFSSMRVATLHSKLLDPDTAIVVVERNLRDSIVFHKVWERLLGLEQYRDFFKQFYSLLGSGELEEYDEHVIWLKCPLPIIEERLSRRGLVSESAHTSQVLSLLETGYNNLYDNSTPRKFTLHTIESDEYDLSSSSIDSFVSKVDSLLNIKWRS